MNDSFREHEHVNAAQHRFLAEIDEEYPHGWFVAIEDENVLAASADFDELLRELAKQGRNPRDTLVVEAGARRPGYVTIFIF